jgi:hypothetical protein
MAAPGTPNACVTPSFSITSTAAIAALIFVMAVSWIESKGSSAPMRSM